MANYAGEFTPEITQNYLQNLQRPIQQQGAVDIGKARGEALRRGMAGDPFEALRVGAAQNTMNTNMSNTNANLGFQVAGVAQQERMGNENRASQQAFSAAESEKDRVFQERMAVQQRNYEQAMQRARDRMQRRGFWPNTIGNIASTAAGFGVSKLF